MMMWFKADFICFADRLLLIKPNRAPTKNAPSMSHYAKLSAIKAKAGVTTVMADDEYSDRLFINAAKHDGVWKTVHETPANTVLDNGILRGTFTNASDGRIYFGPKLITEANTLLVVVSDGIIEIGYGERVISDLHSKALLVRRRNSA